MTGHFNILQKKFNKICWTDSEIQEITIEYDVIKIKLKVPMGRSN